MDYFQITGHYDRIPFKLFDDDGELYYEGFIVLGDDDRIDAPLYDFGQPNAGCTEIFIGKSEGVA